jgi:ArsR family transcriptional regulator
MIHYSSSDTEMASFCKALGHPARMAIIRYLIQQDRCICGKIVDVLGLAQSTVSQHLKVLKDAGIIQGTIEGVATCYCINHKHLQENLNKLSSLQKSTELTS